MEPVEPFLGPLHDVAKAFTGLTGVPVDIPTALFLRADLTGLPPPRQGLGQAAPATSSEPPTAGPP
ncbi:hypothetical protein HEP87_58405 [Streptomyces sp. S1D4-11]